MSQLWKTFDDWTLTDCGQRNGQLQMGGVGQDCELAGNFTALGGSITYAVMGSNLVSKASGAATFGRARMNGVTHGRNTRVYGRLAITDRGWAGMYALGQDTNDRDHYWVRTLEQDSWRLERMDNDSNVLLGSTAKLYSPGDIQTVFMSFDSGGVSAVDVTNNLTVARVADTTYTGTGNCGVESLDLSRFSNSTDWMYVESSLLSGTAVSTTYDAGSSIDFDGISADTSANGGSVTFDVSAVASGSPNYVETGLTLTNGAAAFTAKRTARYWHVRINFTRSNTTQNIGVTRGSVRLSKGPASTVVQMDNWHAGFD